jgi:hypothetical protein
MNKKERRRNGEEKQREGRRGEETRGREGREKTAASHQKYFNSNSSSTVSNEK